MGQRLLILSHHVSLTLPLSAPSAFQPLVLLLFQLTHTLSSLHQRQAYSNANPCHCIAKAAAGGYIASGVCTVCVFALHRSVVLLVGVKIYQDSYCTLENGLPSLPPPTHSLVAP